MKSLIILFLTCALMPLVLLSQITHTVEFPSGDISFTNEAAQDGNTYTKVSIQDLPKTTDEGKPQLTVKCINLIIPAGQSIDSIILGPIVTESISVPYPIYPAQTPILACLECTVPDFVNPDSLIYNSSNPWPSEIVKEVHQGYFDGNNNIVRLSICPFQYYPLTGELIYYTTISFDLVLKTGYPDGITDRNRLEKNQPIYDEILTKLVDNPQDIPLYQSLPNIVTNIISNGPVPYYEYIIITKNDFVSAFDEFIEWKKKKGINIGVVTIEDIKANYNGDELFPGYEIYDLLSSRQYGAGKVRQYLHDAYVAGGATWILLAGDVTVLPVRWGSGKDNPPDWNWIIEADLYFADFTGNWNVDNDNTFFEDPAFYGEPTEDLPDYFPEIFVGRLICSSQQDILNWVHKVLIYERNPGNGDYSYLTQSLMIQADEFQAQDQANSVAPYLPSFNHTIVQEQPNHYDDDPTSPKGADVVNILNANNYGLMSCFNHGGSGRTNSGIVTASGGIHAQGGVGYKLDAEEAYDYPHQYDPNCVHEDNDGLDNLTNINHPFIIYSLACAVNPYGLTKAIGNGGARNFGESFTVNNRAGGIAFLGCTRHSWINYTFDMYKIFADLITSPQNQQGGQFSSHLGVAELVSKALFYQPNPDNYYHFLNYSHNLIGCPETEIWTATPDQFAVQINPSYVFVNELNQFEVIVDNLTHFKDAIVCLYKENEFLYTQTITGDANNHAIAIFDQISATSTGKLFVTITSHNYIPYEEVIPVVEYCSYINIPIIINSDITWNTGTYCYSDVIVKAGYELRIESDVSMVPDARIIVERNANLVIDGGTITTPCDGLWKGIEVHGVSYEPQNSGNQGMVQIINNSTIENASCGIKTYKPVPIDNSHEPFEYTGGIIIANEAKFINNITSVDILPYNYQSMNSFTKCTFEANNNYIYPGFMPDCFVKLSCIDGVDIKGCTFIDDHGTLNPEDRMIGINAINSNFWVNHICISGTNPCTDYQPTSFENLLYGIKAIASVGGKSVDIKNSVFKNNGTGIYLSEIDNAAINLNTFQNIQGAYFDYFTGLYLDECTGYQVEENQFINYLNNTDKDYTGLVVNESGAENNEIYNNYFENLNYGAIAQGCNKGKDEWIGLQIKCNDYVACEYDIVVTAEVATIGTGIAKNQGSDAELPTAPANCTFSYTWIHETSDYHNECEDIIYWYPFNDDGFKVKPEKHSIPEVNPQTNSQFTDPYNKVLFCPSNLGGGGGIEDEKGTMALAGQQADSIQNLLSLLVDGGNTEAIDNEVQTSIPEEALQLRDALLSDSPYLTDTVLVSATNKENVLTPSLVTEILSANPQSAKSDTVQQALNDRTEQLTEDQRTIIDQGWFVISAKESLEAKLSYYKANRSRALNNIIRHFRDDTISPSPVDSIIEILNNENQLWAKYALAFEYLSKDDSLNVVNTLDNILSSFILTTQQTTHHQLYEDYLDLLLEFRAEDKTIFETDSVEKAELYTFYNDASGDLKAMIRNLLIVIDSLTYNEPYILPGSLKSGKIRRIPVRKIYTENNFKLYPNPASKYVIIEYSVKEENFNAFIQIIDNSGKIIKSLSLQENHAYQVIPLNDLPNGIYICKFVINNKIIEAEKLIITH